MSNDLISDALPLPDPSIGWIIYGTKSCSYCNRAKSLLDERKQEYVYIDVGNYPNGRNSLITMANGYRTVPVIYHNGQFIGGYTDLCKLKMDDT